MPPAMDDAGAREDRMDEPNEMKIIQLFGFLSAIRRAVGEILVSSAR
jgi:hypothetical protein